MASLWIYLLLAIALTTSACPSSQIGCKSDNDCPVGSVCVSGVCVFEPGEGEGEGEGELSSGSK